MSHPFPLRYTIPALLLLLGVLLAVIVMYADVHVSAQAVETEMRKYAASLGNRVAGNIENMYARGDAAHVVREINVLSTEPHLKLALVCDDKGRVSAASEPALKGRLFADLPAQSVAGLTACARETISAQLVLRKDGLALEGVFPYRLAALPEEVMSSRMGILYLAFDLQEPVKAQMAESLNRIGLMGVAVLLILLVVWRYMDRILTRRAASLIAATREMAAGNLSAHTDLHGSDELARLGEAFNNMTGTLQIQTEALRESEREFRSLAESMPHMVRIDRADGWAIYFNQQWVDYTGLTLEQSYGQGWNATLHPDDRQRVRDDWQYTVQNECPYSLECRLRRSDGTYRWWLVRGVPFRDMDGKVLKWFGTCTDIDEVKKAESELQKVDKLQSIGTLAGGIAHDFNNILQGLFGNISLAMEVLSKEHPGYAPLEDAEKSMSRAVRLTKQLLTFAKGGVPVKEAVSLGAMVEETVRFDLSGSTVRLVCHQAEDLWPVDADRGQIQQVVSNLVVNARQAMPSGGHLTVTLENAELPAEAVPGLGQGRYVKVSVRDEGCGIEPGVIGRIFDPYFTTKPTGSGLGLATVWSIIAKHGGHIGVTSELGKGATFTIHLPASAVPRREEETSKRPAHVISKPAKILVMDDEASVCRLAVQMLSPCGYSVTTTPGGREAIARCKQALEAGEPFDVAIMDLTIPGGVGGVQAIKDLLELTPHVRAIVSSGYADDPAMANPAAYGFKAALAKPYSQNELRDAVARILA